jgi:macrolide transport system ATP-binding/permease protein
MRLRARLERFGRRLRRRPEPAAPTELVRPAAMSPVDLGDEAVAGLFARPGRMSLTILGTVIGLTALVATLGLTQTASNRIAGRFDEVSATEILVTARPAPENAVPNRLPWDAPKRLERLDGVVAAGNLSSIDVGEALVTTSPVSDPQRRTDFRLAVQAASLELFKAVRADLRTGRLPDAGHSRRGDRVAVLGPNAAARLDISSVELLPAISIGDEIFLVIGILDSVARQHDLLAAVIIPEGTAQRLYGLASPELVVVETRIGATRLISRQAPLALAPENPEGLKVTFAPVDERLREGVERDLVLLFLTLGGVSLVVGAIGIANVTLVSVMERTGEIGLRRALGATRRHIALQFLLESTAIGVIGGILGASLGTLVVVGVAAQQSWTPVLDPLVPFAAPLVGGLTGFLAGSYPALRAARMEPVDALRSAL